MRYPEMADHVAVVTGAASGIGAAVAAAFAEQGARVVLIDINAAGLERQVAELPAGRALAEALDVSDAAAVEAAVRRAAAWGGVHYLVNCAVSFVAAGMHATTEQWDQALRVNVRGCASTVAACVPHFRPGAAVVNTSSISAHIAQPDRWTYNATKGAILSLTRCQALDLSARGIRVNVISPGWIWTPEVDKAAKGDRTTWEPVWGRFHMLRRLGEAAEVARAALFLCSSDASFITGTELMVDGGYSALSAEGLGDDARFAGTA